MEVVRQKEEVASQASLAAFRAAAFQVASLQAAASLALAEVLRKEGEEAGHQMAVERHKVVEDHGPVVQLVLRAPEVSPSHQAGEACHQ